MIRRGFYSKAYLQSFKAPEPRLPKCGECGLLGSCLSPKMTVDGKGGRKVLILGESPGDDEDRRGKPFVGRAGRKLEEVLRRIGVDMRQDCWLTNSLICWPGKTANKKEAFVNKRIPFCRPNLTRTIELLKPHVIIPLGTVAVKSLIGGLWKEDPGGIGKWSGWVVPCQKPNAWICPTYHPSFLVRDEQKKENPVAELLFERHLEAAFAKEGRPWDKVPDYKKQCVVEMDDRKAAVLIREMTASGRHLAFDFESDRAKPHHPDAEIVCCSVCDGKVSVGYPWLGEAVKATKEMLRSDSPKIGYNIKHEKNWALCVLGVAVRRWAFDGMLASHVLDSRRGTAGLEFQEFVRLGLRSHKSHVKPYLKAEAGSAKNRIREIDLPSLLLYCAMDSLVEWIIAFDLARELGVPL